MLTGFLLGSSAAICFGLLGVAVVFLMLGPEQPALRREVLPLLTHLGRFAALTAAAAFSFYGLLRDRPWRRLSVAVLLLVLGGLVLVYARTAAA
jgi:drug/metabolite transporter (DMT)-like permease